MLTLNCKCSCLKFNKKSAIKIHLLLLTNPILFKSFIIII